MVHCQTQEPSAGLHYVLGCACPPHPLWMVFCFQEDNVGLVGRPVYPSLSTHVTKVSFCVDLYKTESSIKLL